MHKRLTEIIPKRKDLHVQKSSVFVVHRIKWNIQNKIYESVIKMNMLPLLLYHLLWKLQYSTEICTVFSTLYHDTVLINLLLTSLHLWKVLIWVNTFDKQLLLLPSVIVKINHVAPTSSERSSDVLQNYNSFIKLYLPLHVGYCTKGVQSDPLPSRLGDFSFQTLSRATFIPSSFWDSSMLLGFLVVRFRIKLFDIYTQDQKP